MNPIQARILCVAGCAAACGGSGAQLAGDAGKDHAFTDARRDSSRHDASNGREASVEAAADAASTYPAAHPPMPLVHDAGGPVLAHPRIVPVFFEADPDMGDVLTFLGKLRTATYWAGATGEYGVGPLIITPPVVVPGPPPATLDDATIGAMVVAHLNGELPDAGPEAGVDGGTDGGAAWPMPDTDTVYALFFAQATTIAFNGITSCVDFAGYHNEVTYAGGSTSYAVLPRCASFGLLPGKGTMDILTVAASHELAEAATDPFPYSNPAFVSADFEGTGWSQSGVGGEIGDMCVLEPSSFVRPSDVGYLVQRVWSNANAAASHDPCAPVPPGEVYFNAVPDLVSTKMKPPSLLLDGVRVVPGSTTTVTLHLFSDARTSGPWTLSVSESGMTGTHLPPDPMHQLSFVVDKPMGMNGDAVQLTISRAPLAPGEKKRGLGFQVTSTLGATSHSYWGIAGYD